MRLPGARHKQPHRQLGRGAWCVLAAARPDERAAFAARARERALAEHTYAARMEALLAFAAAKLPGWPRRSRDNDAALSCLPEATREEVADLLRRLSLPADVAFDDLIWAVRSRQGELTPLETSLLFLDEWRKQYGAA